MFAPGLTSRAAGMLYGGFSAKEACCVSRVLIALIMGYRRWLSPLFGANCRFTPTCSSYAMEAIRRHGCIKGVWYTLWRILRCQPFCKGGFDPVP